MELDEMKLAWQELDARVQRTHALNLLLLKDSGTVKARRRLRPLVFGQALQLAIGVALSVWGASLWASHLRQLDVLVCGLTVHAYGVLLIVFAARNLYLIQHIDYAAPVLDIQRRLAELRAFRVRVEAPVNLAICSFLWIPPMWVGLAAVGFDVPVRVFMYWAIGSSLTGLAALLLVVWTMRWMGYGRKVKDNSAGRSIVRAQAALDEIARFERE
ncbi:MAG: hypothetical protein ACREPZ_10785 [Rhodanobacteraceae bacterium]